MKFFIYSIKEIYMNKSKSVLTTILWVLGWIICFPIPLTILIVRSNMKIPVKIAILVIVWGGLYAIGKYNNTQPVNETQNGHSIVETQKTSNDAPSTECSTTPIETTITIGESINTTETMATSTVIQSTSPSATTSTITTTVLKQEETTTTTTELVMVSNDLIVKDYPAVFDNFTPINLGGVEITIDRLKICADLSNPESQYNFYYVVMEYTVANNTESDCYWEIHRTGNIYGSFSFDGYDRYLGGNHNIKDKEIVSEWRNKSSLSSNEKVTCSMALVVDREMDDPPNGLMLRHNSKMTITLPIKIDNVQNEIVIDLNED